MDNLAIDAGMPGADKAPAAGAVVKGSAVVRKSPNPIDIHVGGRVRMRRMLIGMSQEKLGEQLGLTFQQVQKYEKGANRIGASRLFEISRILGVPVDFFFEGLEAAAHNGASNGFSDTKEAGFDLDVLATSEGIQLNSAFFSIREPAVRKRVLDLVKTLGKSEELGESL
jgi:transcriptional regulator with XRE-family HTH domain